MSITVEQFETLLERQEFSPVYLFHGEEEFQIEEGVKSLLTATLEPGTREFNCDILYGGDSKADDVVALCNAFPLMAERRIVLIRDFGKLPGKEPTKGASPEDVAFIRYIKNPSPTTVLILAADEPDMRRSPYTVLSKNAVVVNCKKLYERDALKWMERRVQRAGKTLGPAASRLLLSQ